MIARSADFYGPDAGFWNPAGRASNRNNHGQRGHRPAGSDFGKLKFQAELNIATGVDSQSPQAGFCAPGPYA